MRRAKPDICGVFRMVPLPLAVDVKISRVKFLNDTILLQMSKHFM